MQTLNRGSVFVRQFASWRSCYPGAGGFLLFPQTKRAATHRDKNVAARCRSFAAQSSLRYKKEENLWDKDKVMIMHETVTTKQYAVQLLTSAMYLLRNSFPWFVLFYLRKRSLYNAISAI